ncbi:UPF0573 protein C2orf70 homolog B-like [Dendronephthya gigantea]|uniref:UPF0573 protein C2orf70 homolog B-like n=1 Tax=Dendronephthya gigantea TaxID=151771 RepID=UPI00106B8189|nr:UPF0573 protein C2orf70 homolog B-like [Dendronephthya gigantea]
MANHLHDKYTTTSREAYSHPKSVPAYRYYMPERPQTFGKTFQHGEGTKRWFHDYRRTQVAEKVMKENLESAGIDVRPTWHSDKPDRVLGARCADREELLNRPDYKMFNRLPDRERDLAEFVERKEEHRNDYKDLTGRTHKVDFFHYPTEASEQFVERGTQSSSKMTDYPNPHKGALEYTWETQRGPKHYELYRGVSDFNYHKKIPEI